VIALAELADEGDLAEIWSQVVDSLQEHYGLNPRQLSIVMKAKPMTVFGNTVMVSVPNEATRAHLETNIREELSAALQEVFGYDVGFGVHIDPKLNDDITGTATSDFSDLDKPEPLVPSYAVPSSTHLVNPVPPPILNPNYSFKSFVTGSSNRMAQAAAFAVAELPAKAYNPLFIYGGSGLGKTHLLHAIGHYAYNLYPNMRVRYTTAENFFTDYTNAIAVGGGMPEFRRRWRDVDILLIDDIQFFQGKEKGQEEFFHTFEALHSSSRQIVITSDLAPQHLPGFEERYRSRFSWGLITDVQKPELETRIAILKRKSESQRLEVSQEVLTYIGSKITTNIRELEGGLTRLAAYASLNKQPITMRLAEEVLREIVVDEEPITVTGQEVMEMTSNYFGLSVDDLIARNRAGSLIEARSIAMYLCRELTDMSYPDIAKLFLRDHSSVMTAVRKVTNQLSERVATYNQVAELTTRIKQMER
jgi:chromosomal replication initiator protein